MDQVVNVKSIQSISKLGKALDEFVSIRSSSFSPYHRCTSEQNPFELIHGDQFIYETYNKKKFRISPESFQQVNQRSAQFIYSTVLKHAQIDENTILLDIGSGVGKDAFDDLLLKFLRCTRRCLFHSGIFNGEENLCHRSFSHVHGRWKIQCKIE